jgi:hypothetical protein
MQTIEEDAYKLANVHTPAVVTATEMAAFSIAISLKRIADALEGVPYDQTPGADNSKHRMGITDGIMHAIEQGIISASRR